MLETLHYPTEKAVIMEVATNVNKSGETTSFVPRLKESAREGLKVIHYYTFSLVLCARNRLSSFEFLKYGKDLRNPQKIVHYPKWVITHS